MNQPELNSRTARPPSLGQEIGKRLPFEVAEEEAYLNIARTWSVLAGDFDRLYRTAGVSQATYNILRMLRAAGESGRTCGQIGGMLVAQGPDVTRLVDRLEQSGLVTRDRTGEDRRVVTVRITPAGLERVNALDAPVLNLHRGQLGHLSREELTELSRLLVKARRPQDYPRGV